MSEAIAAVKQDVKAVPMKYKKDRTDEQEELKRLEEERANVVQEQKDAEADKAETESLAPEEKTFKKRYGDLRRHAQQKEQELKDKIRELEGQISTATKEAIKLPKSDDELAAWTKEYPDVAKVIETIATKKALELDKGMEDRLKAIAEKEAEADRRAEVARRTAETEIQKAQYVLEQERLRAEEIVREEIAKTQIEIAAEAEAERARRVAKGEADAILYKYEAEAKGVQQVLDAKAAGYGRLIESSGGDARAAATLLMVEKIENMVSAQVEAIRNLKIDKITVWDGGNGGCLLYTSPSPRDS